MIDYQRILRDAKAARSIREQVEARRKLYQDEIAKEEQRLHEADKELARAAQRCCRPRRSPTKREAFEREVAAVQRMAQERRRQLDQVAAAALNEVRTAMIEVVGELADARGFNLVLPTSGLLLFSPGDRPDRRGDGPARRQAAEREGAREGRLTGGRLSTAASAGPAIATATRHGKERQR